MMFVCMTHVRVCACVRCCCAFGAGFLPACLPSQVPRQAYEEDVKMSYSISPVSQSTKLLSKPSKAKRKIPKIPFKASCIFL